MNSQGSDVEILVHTTASSRIIDDVAYRQLARSYLAFQPSSRTTIVPSTQDHPNPTSSQPGCKEQHIPSTPDLQLCRDSQDLSFDGAFGNRSSPRLRKQMVCTPKKSPQRKSPRKLPTAKRALETTPPSEVADSYPMPDLGFFKVTPTRALSRYLTENTTSSSAPDSSPSPIRIGRLTRSSNPPQAIDIPSSIPIPSSGSRVLETTLAPLPLTKDTIPVTPVVKDAAHKQQSLPIDFQDADLADITHISSSFASNLSTRAESEPPPKRHKCAQNPVQPIHRSVSDTGPQTSSLPLCSSSGIDIFESYPPSPPVSITNLAPDDMISEKLDKLASDLSSRYRPRPHRHIDPLERGFWNIDCSSWHDGQRIETWAFLHNYIRSGLAGWAVWSRRDEKTDSLRLYCWGHVVKHTYLLLYLASGRRIKATGATWHGATGEATITVPAIDRGG